jgi:hypothetical protein
MTNIKTAMHFKRWHFSLICDKYSYFNFKKMELSDLNNTTSLSDSLVKIPLYWYVAAWKIEELPLRDVAACEISQWRNNMTGHMGVTLWCHLYVKRIITCFTHHWVTHLLKFPFTDMSRRGRSKNSHYVTFSVQWKCGFWDYESVIFQN